MEAGRRGHSLDDREIGGRRVEAQWPVTAAGRRDLDRRDVRERVDTRVRTAGHRQQRRRVEAREGLGERRLDRRRPGWRAQPWKAVPSYAIVRFSSTWFSGRAVFRRAAVRRPCVYCQAILML